MSKVWCATEVDANGIMKPGMFGNCEEDERDTAYDGPGNILIQHTRNEYSALLTILMSNICLQM